MQRLEVSGAVRPIYGSLGVKRLICDHQHLPQKLFYAVTTALQWHMYAIYGTSNWIARRVSAKSRTGEAARTNHKWVFVDWECGSPLQCCFIYMHVLVRVLVWFMQLWKAVTQHGLVFGELRLTEPAGGWRTQLGGLSFALQALFLPPDSPIQLQTVQFP